MLPGMYSIDDNKTQKTSKNIKTSEIVFYTIVGKEKNLDKDGFPVLKSSNKLTTAEPKETYSKQVHFGTTKYYIKRDSNGHLYNPLGMFSEGISEKVNTQKGKKHWTWSEVTKEVFILYNTFLKTKNAKHLRQAERSCV